MSFLSSSIDYLNGVVVSDTGKRPEHDSKMLPGNISLQSPSRMEWIARRQLLFICKQNNTMPQTTSDGMNFAQDSKQKGREKDECWGSQLGTQDFILSLEWILPMTWMDRKYCIWSCRLGATILIGVQDVTLVLQK